MKGGRINAVATFTGSGCSNTHPFCLHRIVAITVVIITVTIGLIDQLSEKLVSSEQKHSISLICDGLNSMIIMIMAIIGMTNPGKKTYSHESYDATAPMLVDTEYVYTKNNNSDLLNTGDTAKPNQLSVETKFGVNQTYPQVVSGEYIITQIPDDPNKIKIINVNTGLEKIVSKE
uniref:VP12 n=1 Tax=Liao ning virus TaxID=246280 RepID=A0A2P1NS25_9REOV|nr:VP12 [Liao ning virus]AVP72177.1 VP12 [Liao ning virus]